MNKYLKHFVTIGATLALGASIVGCGGKKQEGSGTVEVDFWSAPQKVQYDYWVKKADDFNAANIKVNGKTVKVNVQQMPESPSSEAGIQNAIATDTVPAISENINRGFAATLAKSEAIYPLNEEKWFEDVVSSRKMDEAIKGWKIDDKQYVLPIYVNPIMWQWNMAALRELGFNEAPKTVDDLKSIIEKFRENKDTKMKSMGVNSTFYRPSLLRPDQWWDRWFDFQMQYEAFTGGKPWVDGDKLVLDKTATKEVFELYGMFGNTLQTAEVANLWQDKNISVLASMNAPWEIQAMRAANKKYGVDGDYIYGPSLVKNAGDKPYCFGDSKGLVLYKHKNISEDQHQGAVEFVKWLYNKDNTAKTDLDWLKATTMLPVRGDLTENEDFKGFLNENPELKDLAQYIPYAVPSMATEKMTDIQTALTEKGMAPYIEATKKLNNLSVPDASPFVDKAFEAMIQQGGLK